MKSYILRNTQPVQRQINPARGGAGSSVSFVGPGITHDCHPDEPDPGK